MNQRGFTLLEVMVVLVISAILSLIAYNVYSSYVRRAQRSNARARLMETAQYMERYYTAHNHYPKKNTISKYKNWKIKQISTNNYQSYKIKATKVGGISDTKCSTMLIINTGKKTPASCWKSH